MQQKSIYWYNNNKIITGKAYFDKDKIYFANTRREIFVCINKTEENNLEKIWNELPENITEYNII